MTFMMTSSSDDKVTFVKFVIKTYSILSIQYVYKISYKIDIHFLRYSMFFLGIEIFKKKPSPVRVKQKL